MLAAWERQFPGRIDAIFGAIKNVSPSQLADTQLFDFASLGETEAEIEVEGIAEVESYIHAINV